MTHKELSSGQPEITQIKIFTRPERHGLELYRITILFKPQYLQLSPFQFICQNRSLFIRYKINNEHDKIFIVAFLSLHITCLLFWSVIIIQCSWKRHSFQCASMLNKNSKAKVHESNNAMRFTLFCKKKADVEAHAKQIYKKFALSKISHNSKL